jgi:type I restriction enzyme M protein
MANLVFLPIESQIKSQDLPALRLRVRHGRHAHRRGRDAHGDSEGAASLRSGALLYGQEINPETYAVCKADMLLKGEG